MRCHFIPGYLLEHLAQTSDEAVAECGRRTAVIDERVRSRPAAAPQATGTAWEVHDAENGSALPGRLVRSAGEPDVGDVDRRRGSHGDHGVARALQRLRPRLLRRPGGDSRRDGALRAGLRQRVLGRHPAGVRRRGRPGLRAVHQADRRPGPRAVPRGHPVHRRSGLRRSVRGAERVDVGRLRLVHQAALPRPGRCVRGLAGRGGDLPARHQRSCPALDVRPRHCLRRPADRQGPAGRVDGGLRGDHGRQRRRAPEQRDPQPRVRAGRPGHRRGDVERRRSDLVRRPHLRSGRRQRLRHLRRGHRLGGGRTRGRGPGRVGHRGRGRDCRGGTRSGPDAGTGRRGHPQWWLRGHDQGGCGRPRLDRPASPGRPPTRAAHRLPLGRRQANLVRTGTSTGSAT